MIDNTLDKIEKMYNIQKEWIPKGNDKNWIKKDGYWKYDSEKLKEHEIVYTLDKEFIDTCKKILDIKKNKKYEYITHKTEYKIVKIFKVYNNITQIISVTSTTIEKTIKMVYETFLKNVTEEKRVPVYYDSFPDTLGLKIKMLYCYKFEKSVSKIKTDELKRNVISNSVNTIEQKFSVYYSILDKLFKDDCVEKKKYYFFKSHGNILFTKNKKDTVDCKILEECMFRSDSEAELKIEQIKTENDDNVIYKIYDDTLNIDKLAKIREHLINVKKLEAIKNLFDDFSEDEYEDIKTIFVKIQVLNNVYIDDTKNITGKEYISDLFLNKQVGKKKKISELLKESKIDDIDIEYVDMLYLTDKKKVSIMRDEIMKVYKNKRGLKIM